MCFACWSASGSELAVLTGMCSRGVGFSAHSCASDLAMLVVVVVVVVEVVVVEEEEEEEEDSDIVFDKIV